MEANDQTNEKLTSLKSIVESISPKRVISLKEQIACKQDELEKWKAILDVAEKRTKRFFNSFSVAVDDKDYKEREVLKQLEAKEDEIALKKMQMKQEILNEEIVRKQDELGPQEKICEPKKKQLTRDDFLSWRREHDGPKSRSAFKVWRRNGGRDFENFRNNSRRGGGRGGRERGVAVNHYY
ncbi:uncharacterized protein LOC124810925 isoform X2 [Hydra vulgaris]|uniref:uncharacterized protein LOC124810925 isoform X2 n=1 Tax=Hydra vulgaris TaxID=6087 RepID=UPI0032EA210A